MQNGERRGPQEPWGFGLYALGAAIREACIRFLIFMLVFLASGTLGAIGIYSYLRVAP